MASQFLLQIVERDSGKVLSWEPGSAVEADLVSAVTEKLADKPVGIFTTRAQVAEVVGATLREVIRELKLKV